MDVDGGTQPDEPDPTGGAGGPVDRLAQVRDRLARARRRELAAHQRAIDLHEQAAELQERLGRSDRAATARWHAQHARELYEQACAEGAEDQQ
jgi:chemotaxis regulatin CheY-phosphate phosphatase CheZ